MKKAISLVLFSLFFSFGAFAQLTHTADGSVDENANSILKKAANKMNGTIGFTVTVVNYDSNKKETFRQKADILYNAPRYRVKSGELEIYCDGKSVWQLNKTAKEVVITPMTDSDDDLTNPAKLLANYTKNYRAKFIREEEDGTTIIDLQPKKSRTYHKIRLYIDSKTGQLKKLEQHNYDSSRCAYTISNLKNTKAADADFTYDSTTHPGIEEVDMR